MRTILLIRRGLPMHSIPCARNRNSRSSDSNGCSFASLEEPEWPAEDQSDAAGVRNVTRRLARGNLIGHSGAVIHRPRLLSVGGYDARLAILEDYDLWIRLAKQGHVLGISGSVRIAKRYHAGQKFSRRRGYLFAAWKTQLRAIMAIDRNYRNFAWLGMNMLRDTRPGATAGHHDKDQVVVPGLPH